MSLSPESESSNPTVGSPRRLSRTFSATTWPPRPRRSLSLVPAMFIRVRGTKERRDTRDKTDEIQSNPKPYTKPRTTTSTFPDLVLQIMHRGKSGMPETSDDSNAHIPHVQEEGKKAWEEFNNQAVVLEKDLQKFQDAVKELGSSMELTGAARNLRKSISLTSRLFEDNARKLFPKAFSAKKVVRLSSEFNQRLNSRANANKHVEARPIHMELNAMSESVRYLRHALEHFLEFGVMADEDLPLSAFEGDLNYWSLYLEHYEGQFESQEVRLYIHDLSRELGDQFEDTSRCLREFIDGVPTARLSQKHATSNLQNLATIATFFSAVTATTIQYSYTKNDLGVDKAVNVFWFSSLVFSIASALNSFLVLTWRRASYSSPLLHIPWWLWFWIRQCPPVFLLVSVVTFLAGLGCFTISSAQAHFTSVIVIISEAISAFGLAALLVWLAYDKWCFYRRRQSPLPVFRFATSLQKKGENGLPLHHERAASSSVFHDTFGDDAASVTTEMSPTFQKQAQMQNTRPPTDAQMEEKVRQRARQRWSWAFQEVRRIYQDRCKEIRQELVESRRMDKLDTGLQNIAVCHEVAQQEAGTDINDIQFDHHGKALAICSNKRSMRYELDSAQVDEKYDHHIGQAHQVVWTSSGYLVTRKRQAIHVWLPSRDPVPQVQIFRGHSHYLLSLSDREALDEPKLLSVEGEDRNQLAIIDMKGNGRTIAFDNIRIQHVDVVPDGTRVLLAAVIPRVEERQPTKASPGRKLMIFNLENQRIEHDVPLWHDVQHVTISVNGRWAVVTYKDSLPPQLWSLQHTPGGVHLALERQFCARERIAIDKYDPGQNIRFSGRAHFIGNDRYILCATVDGKIHIWRRDRAHSVHVHSGLTLEKDKPMQIACNRANKEGFMFATRSYDGTIRIWKIQEPPANETDKSIASGSNSTKPSGITRLVTSLDVLSESPQASPQDERSPVTEFVSTDTSRLVTAGPQPSSLTVHPDPALGIGAPDRPILRLQLDTLPERLESGS